MYNGILRPKTSDNGPKIIGPKANPRTNRLVAKVMTSSETPNSAAVCTVAVLKTDEAKVTQKVIMARRIVALHFFSLLQFIGFSGSSLPFHVMTFGSSE